MSGGWYGEGRGGHVQCLVGGTGVGGGGGGGGGAMSSVFAGCEVLPPCKWP